MCEVLAKFNGRRLTALTFFLITDYMRGLPFLWKPTLSVSEVRGLHQQKCNRIFQFDLYGEPLEEMKVSFESTNTRESNTVRQVKGT